MELDQANLLIKATNIIAQKMGLKPLAVVILSTDGTVRASITQTGASPARFAIAKGKADGTLKMRCSSRKLAEMAQERPEFFASLNNLTNVQGIIAAAGALLVRDNQGELIGSIGISGDTSDNDEACAITAIDEAGLFL